MIRIDKELKELSGKTTDKDLQILFAEITDENLQVHFGKTIDEDLLKLISETTDEDLLDLFGETLDENLQELFGDVNGEENESSTIIEETETNREELTKDTNLDKSKSPKIKVKKPKAEATKTDEKCELSNIKTKRGKDKKQNLKKGKSKATKENTEEFVSDFDLMRQKKKLEQAKRKRRRSDAEDDELTRNLIKQMERAANDDIELFKQNSPTTKKLKLLPDALTLLRQVHLRDSFMDQGILPILTKWITPISNKNLPSSQIVENILHILRLYTPININLLKSSGIFKAIKFIVKHPAATKCIVEMAKKLIEEWLVTGVAEDQHQQLKIIKILDSTATNCIEELSSSQSNKLIKINNKIQIKSLVSINSNSQCQIHKKPKIFDSVTPNSVEEPSISQNVQPTKFRNRRSLSMNSDPRYAAMKKRFMKRTKRN